MRHVKAARSFPMPTSFKAVARRKKPRPTVSRDVTTARGVNAMANHLTLLNPPPPPEEPPPTVWLVNGVLTIADNELVTALRELADHMDLCGPGLLIGNLTGLSVNDHLRVTWSIRIPSREQLTEVLGQPDPMTGYRLLTLTVTRNPDRET
jgi:hypothetical protein